MTSRVFLDTIVECVYRPPIADHENSIGKSKWIDPRTTAELLWEVCATGESIWSFEQVSFIPRDGGYDCPP